MASNSDTQSNQKIGLKFVFENGIADDHVLDLYDASVAIHGIARSAAITSNALINKKVRLHGERAKGAQLFLLPSKKGSFEIDVAIWIAGAIGSGIAYDFIKHAFKAAVGADDIDETPYKGLKSRIEPTMGELEVALESALLEIHRPLLNDKQMTLKVTRPRGEVLAEFNQDTAKYLQPILDSRIRKIQGNVTKYNTNTGWGRVYDIKLKKTVSFHYPKDSSSAADKELITWSLHETNMERDGSLLFEADAVVTASKKIKRYNIKSVQQV